MKKSFIIITFIFFVFLGSVVPVQAAVQETISMDYISKVESMTQEEIEEALEIINSSYDINEPFDKDDELFIRALHYLEEKDSFSVLSLPPLKSYHFNTGPAKGYITYRWYHFSRTLLTTGYAGQFYTHFPDRKVREKIRLYSISIEFTAYGIVGSDGIGIIKKYNDISNFSISTSASTYSTSFDTWSYSPVLWSNTKISLKFTDVSRTYTDSFSISVQ